MIDKLLKKYDFYVWQKIDTENSAIRIVTSWATSENVVNDFIDELNKI
jgi:threonine aldolase